MKKRILFVATFPPPIHGSAVMSQYIKESKLINDTFDCDYINLSTSRGIDEIGIFNPIKIWRLFIALFVMTWKLSIKHYDLCYLAITCHGIGFLKDAPFVFLCKLFRRKVVIHQHNKGMSKDLERWPYSWLLPLTYKNVKVILLSQRLYQDIDKVVPKENVYICPNGIPEVDCEYKYMERRNEIPHLLFLSNLMESKGVIVLLDALKILKGKGLSFICDFVGGETKEVDLVRFEHDVVRHGLSQIAIYKGRKVGAEKEDSLLKADLFIFPTFYHNECFPLVLLEAMQYGLPIVTTDEGGIPDIVKDGENGLICEKNNPDSLANCIEMLLKDNTLREEYGRKGRDLFEKKYSLYTFECRMTEILGSC